MRYLSFLLVSLSLWLLSVSTVDVALNHGHVASPKVFTDMIEKQQLRELITKILKEVDYYSPEAVELMMMTAAVESRLGSYLRQVDGPALGIFQMEPGTELDIWHNYLKYRDGLSEMVANYSVGFRKDELEWNLAYQIIMTRIHYFRVPQALPPVDDITGMAWYWKKHYNSKLGKGTVDKAVKAYKELCL
jgi:hypothetical protein